MLVALQWSKHQVVNEAQPLERSIAGEVEPRAVSVTLKIHSCSDVACRVTNT